MVTSALAGAGCCAGAAAIVWWRRTYHDPLTGPLQVSLKGSQILGELVPVALVVLAGLGAVFASRGILRRAVGILIGLGGLLVGVRAVAAMGREPTAKLAAELHRPATASGPVDLIVAGPAVALAGGALIVLAGMLVLLGADRARRMGSAYDAPARRREVARTAGTGVESADPGALWRAIDAGTDPTDVPDRAGAPGQAPSSGPDTMGPRDGPDSAAPGRSDRVVVEPPHRSVPTSQASDEETTG